jgi:hypothetical protein
MGDEANDRRAHPGAGVAMFAAVLEPVIVGLLTPLLARLVGFRALAPFGAYPVGGLPSVYHPDRVLPARRARGRAVDRHRG